MKKIFSRFVMVGTVGFLVDLLIYLLFISLDVSVYVARVSAFFVAVQVTYWLNLKFTFAGRVSSKSKYFVGQSGGVLVNFLTFLACYQLFTEHNAIVAFVIGSAIALFYNFLIANFWAFKE